MTRCATVTQAAIVRAIKAAEVARLTVTGLRIEGPPAKSTYTAPRRKRSCRL
jgi:hypothetical protein